MRHDWQMPPERPGGAAVATMAEMTALQQAAIACLRLWPDDPGGPQGLHRSLRAGMPAPQALACREALQDMMDILARHHRRPLVRHAPCCPCVGADEAAFANFVATAATGPREDALLLASLLVGGAAILPLTDAAQRAGLCLHRATLPRRAAMPDPTSATRH